MHVRSRWKELSLQHPNKRLDHFHILAPSELSQSSNSKNPVLTLFLQGSLPFDHQDMSKLLERVRTGKYSMPSWMPAEARSLIQQMLQVAPEKRISVSVMMYSVTFTLLSRWSLALSYLFLSQFHLLWPYLLLRLFFRFKTFSNIHFCNSIRRIRKVPTSRPLKQVQLNFFPTQSYSF